MIEFTEDRIPSQGLAEAVDDLVELFGGDLQSSREGERRFILPLRRGVAVAGGVECTVSWAIDASDQATVTLVCNRDVDAPKTQRIAILVVGVIGALTFMMWPFFGKHATQLGTLAWIGGFVALAVYFLTLRRTSGGIAYDFLQRLARRQRETTTGP
ncbi:MAG: hypothetical protein DMF59_00905 [Acidobacteria bacterium]|nr:MAG: hypothetical protein DMF59_00905 [Acidobacteriota bacterium]